MYSCTVCDWEVEDDEIETENPHDSKTDCEVKCPHCGNETDWWDGTEEGTIW